MQIIFYEQYDLRSSIDFAIHKIRPGTLIAGIGKSILKGQLKSLLQAAMHFHLSVKGTPAYYKQFVCDALAMVK